MKPDTCVLIPHYNNLDGLEKSLASISNIEPVDVLIVDDGSAIKPNIEELKQKFPQINNINIIFNQRNEGIEHALNKGLKYIKNAGYKYVARLDCGDICFPMRFKIQKEYLDQHPDIYLIGSWVEFVDTKGKRLFFFKPPTSYDDIRKKMFINNMFIHPSVMFRVKVIEEVGLYPTNYKYAEDYYYFFKIIKKLKAVNINKILLRYEVNPKGLSITKRKQQLRSRLKIILDNFDYSFYAFYGLFRNLILYFLPYSLIKILKRFSR